jgi:hypothetical protein
MVAILKLCNAGQEETMKHRTRGRVRHFAVFIFVAAFTFSAAADSQDGTVRDQLIEVLESVAGGECPEALLAPGLVSQCNDHLDVMQQHLSSLGAITGAEYHGVTNLPNGAEVELYLVKFAEETMVWGAAVGTDGKLTAMARRQE